MKKFDICFVCLGNICRSPAADGVGRHLAGDYGCVGEVDSAGTGAWHVGEPPHRTMRKVAWERGVSLEDLRARQVMRKDFDRFDYLVAMDHQNYLDLLSMKPDTCRAKVEKLMSFSGLPDEDVPDPYYGGSEGFVTTFQMIAEGVKNFFEVLKAESEKES
jgi:protein-tyrosine phosphatase